MRLWAFALVGVLACGAAEAADAEAGKKVFAKCVACHTTEAGKNKIGPSLAGIVGKPAAAVPGFNYSEPMKNWKKSWDHENLHAYLLDPKNSIPGNKMIFPGLKSQTERDDVIAYLETQK